MPPMDNDWQGQTTHRLHEVQTKLDKLFTEIQLDKLTDTEPNRYICKGQLLWNQHTDSMRGEILYKFCTKFIINLDMNFMHTKQKQNKTQTKYHSKMLQICNNHTPHMSDRAHTH